MNNLKPGLDRGHTLAGSLGISVEDKRGEGEAGEEAGVGGQGWPGPPESETQLKVFQAL